MITFFKKILGIKVLAVECGHMTKIKDVVTVDGETRQFVLTMRNGQAEICHQCLAAKSISCGHCKKPIYVDDALTHYPPEGLWGCTRKSCWDGNLSLVVAHLHSNGHIRMINF
jgi:hypothetical protein